MDGVYWDDCSWYSFDCSCSFGKFWEWALGGKFCEDVLLIGSVFIFLFWDFANGFEILIF